MPRTKKVALAPSSSSRSKIAAACRSRAGPRESQSARPRPRCTSWCQSSKSKLSKSLATGRPLTSAEALEREPGPGADDPEKLDLVPTGVEGSLRGHRRVAHGRALAVCARDGLDPAVDR